MTTHHRFTLLALSLILSCPYLANCSDLQGSGGGGGGGGGDGGGGGGGGGGENAAGKKDVLVSKSIRIDRDGEKTEIIDKILEDHDQDINLIKIEVRIYCRKAVTILRHVRIRFSPIT